MEEAKTLSVHSDLQGTQYQTSRAVGPITLLAALWALTPQQGSSTALNTGLATPRKFLSLCLLYSLDSARNQRACIYAGHVLYLYAIAPALSKSLFTMPESSSKRCGHPWVPGALMSVIPILPVRVGDADFRRLLTAPFCPCCLSHPQHKLRSSSGQGQWAGGGWCPSRLASEEL